MDRNDILMDSNTPTDHLMDEPLSKPAFLLSSDDPLESKLFVTIQTQK